MKKIFTLMLFVAVSVTMFAQAPKVEDRVATLEGEVNSLKSQMSAAQSEISQLKDRYAQYQKQLDLRQVTKVEVDTIEYGVVSAVGDKATGKVTITLYAVNKGKKDCEIQLSGAQMNDYDGNVYNIRSDSFDDFINIGSPTGGCREALRTNIAVKIYITFEKVAVGARISALHTKEIAHHKLFSSDANIDFRDIPIEWK